MKTTIEWPKRFSELKVCSRQTQLGRLAHDSQFVFAYNDNAPRPCSLTMPIQTASYNRGALHPIFEMNLPEGFLRKYISDRLIRHTKVNDMMFLALQGDRSIGHLRYESGIDFGSADRLSMSDLLSTNSSEGLFEYLLDRYGLTNTLSGMQPKILVDTDRSTLSYPNCIVKTEDGSFPDLVANEFVCMSLARKCGLSVPDHYLSYDKKLFIIDRFDISNGEKLAFEDFCTLMGLSGEDRYSRSYETAAKVMSLYKLPKPDFEQFFRQIVFSCAIGNGDAHLKNFGIIYDPVASNVVPRLAPAYDLTCTLYYEHLDKKLALSMNKSKDFPNKSNLMAYGRLINIRNPGAVIDEVVALVRQQLKTIDIATDYPKLIALIDEQAGYTSSESSSGLKVPTNYKSRRKKYP